MLGYTKRCQKIGFGGNIREPDFDLPSHNNRLNHSCWKLTCLIVMENFGDINFVASVCGEPRFQLDTTPTLISVKQQKHWPLGQRFKLGSTIHNASTFVYCNDHDGIYQVHPSSIYVEVVFISGIV